MPLLKKIGQMRRDGMRDEQIAQRLREEGNSLREIDEALDQSRVKSAVGDNSTENSANSSVESHRELGPPPTYPQSALQEQRERPQEFLPEEPPAMEAPYPDYQNPDYQNYPQQGYEEYQYPAINTDMIMETAEQIIEEKTKDMQEQIAEFLRFQTETQGRINNIDERIRRIEMIIDRLQASIIQKIGTYDKNITDLKKEMVATQDSFSKVLNPLAEHMEQLRKIAEPEKKSKTKSKTSRKKTSRTKKKDGDEFKNYLRS